ncbi:MAG: PqqD family protein [Paludibacteraceae bacterium]|nr:PqqD family protein [Paludibacteraceae bacterium]
MRLRYSFRFQQIGDTWLGTAVGQNAHLFNGVLQLNEVGHFIVSNLPNPGHLEIPDDLVITSLADQLTKEYAVDTATAQSAILNVLNYLREEGVLD